MAPLAYQAEWDNCGVQIAGADAEATRVAVTLEPTPAALSRCLEFSPQLVLTHHPLYFKLPDLSQPGPHLDILGAFLSAGAWLYAAHTCLDAAPDGPAFWLGREFGLTGTRHIEDTAHSTPIKVSFHVEKPLNRELAETLAGLEGVLSISQDKHQFVRMVCEDRRWEGLARRIEEAVGGRPVYFIKRFERPASRVGIGQIGELPSPMGRDEFLARIKNLTGRSTVALIGEAPETVSTVAYCPGSGGSLIQTAFKLGADVFVTGDVKYHDAVETPGMVVDVGHFSLEEEMTRRFAEALKERSGLDVRFFPGRDPYAFA